MKPVIIFTATDTEDELFRANAARAEFLFVENRTFSGFAAAMYNGPDRAELWHVRTSAGSSGVNASARISEMAVKELRPAFAISVGIAFGVDYAKQSLCDVLVADHILAYEAQRVGETKTEWRGPKLPCCSEVVSYSRVYANLGRRFRVQTGVILSGDKLVDNADFLAKLRALAPTL